MQSKLIVVLISLLSAAGASASLIYENDFASNAAGFSGGVLAGGRYSQVSNDETLKFQLTDSRLTSAVTLMFDVTAIGTWDSSGSLEDYFIVVERISGAANVRTRRNLDRGTNNLMLTDVMPFSDGELRIKFKSDVTGSDELFALDNFKVMTAVTEPGTLVLLGLGLLGAGLRRRR